MAKIKEMFNLVKGSLQSSKCTTGEYNFITASKDWKTHNEYEYNCEALIFAAAASGSLGRTHYVNGKFISSDLCFIITPKDENQFPINLKFYHIIFNTLKEDIVKNTKAGTSKEAIGLKALGEYELPYIDIDKQREISSKFNFTTEISESYGEEITHQIDLIKNLRQAFLREAMQGVLVNNETSDNKTGADLLAEIQAEKSQLVKEKKIKKPKPLAPITEYEIPFEIPENWTWCRLGEVTSIIGDGIHGTPKYDENGSYFFVNGNNLVDFNIFIKNETKRVDEKEYIKYKKDLNSNTVFVSINGTIGNVAYFNNENIILGKSACYFNLITINKYFIGRFLKSNIFLKYAYEMASETTIKNVSLKAISMMPIPLPPLKIQERIVAKLDEVMGYCDALEEQVKQSQQTNELLLQQVLREALSGKGNAKETQEIQIDREEIKTKPTNVDYYKRTLLAAEIVYQLHKEPTLGHLKLQKLIFLCQRTSNMSLPTNFLRQAMGPYDNQLMRSIDKQLVLKKWFEYSKDTLLKYLPLENAGSHKTDYLKYFSQEDDNIQFIISTFRDKKSEIVELVATIYACLENIKETKSIFSEELLIKKFYDWSEEKKKFKKEEIIKAYSRMQELGIIPQNKPNH